MFFFECQRLELHFKLKELCLFIYLLRFIGIKCFNKNWFVEKARTLRKYDFVLWSDPTLRIEPYFPSESVEIMQIFYNVKLSLCSFSRKNLVFETRCGDSWNILRWADKSLKVLFWQTGQISTPWKLLLSGCTGRSSPRDFIRDPLDLSFWHDKKSREEMLMIIIGFV